MTVEDEPQVFITPALIKSAVLTEMEELYAYRGYCPKCKTKGLRHVSFSVGFRFYQCPNDECNAITVLGG